MVTKEIKIKNDYDEIAESWYRLRHWSRFKAELDDVAVRWGGGKLLNIGCAHGPDFLPFKECFNLYGLDSSEQMIKMALKYAAKFNLSVQLLVSDAVSLPFRDNTFECAISVAAYHHIKQRNRRLQAFSELRRVLKPGGEAFITVWNRWQKDFWAGGHEVLKPWKKGDREILRYYYLYSYPELGRQLKKAGFRIIKIFPEYSYNFPVKLFSRNICALVRVD